ncbi:hypothetical protein F5Y06DRAFT_301646 [Hypoxylon sp. FL0890]|nr:hypothetical protein F5Y06DRAFT_301646 [Hypoxylon sp. FL0890]
MPRMPKLYSPYGPRPKRSAQLILIWMVILVLALAATFYLTTRERGATDTRLVDEIDKIKEKAEGNVMVFGTGMCRGLNYGFWRGIWILTCDTGSKRDPTHIEESLRSHFL